MYVDMTGIYHKLDDKKHGPYRITEVFTNGTVILKRLQVNKRIKNRRLIPQFDEQTHWFNLETLEGEMRE